MTSPGLRRCKWTLPGAGDMRCNMLRGIWSGALTACALTALACSGEGGADEGAGGSMAAAGTGGGAAGQAGSSALAGAAGTAQGGDGAGGSGGESGGPSLRSAGGRIQIISFVFNDADYVTAGFWRAETVEVEPNPDPSEPSCTYSTDGHCSLWLCPPSTNGGGAVPPASDPVTFPSAGIIDLMATDPTDPSVLIQATLMPDTQGRYANAQLNQSFTGLENVTLNAQGGEVPAFTHSLDYPLLLLLTNPGLNEIDAGHETLDVSRSQDTVLTWDRGQEGLSLVVQGNTSGGQLNCSFPSEAGAGTLPSSLISQYPGEELIFTSVTASTAQAGDYEISVLTAGDVVTPERDAGIKGVLVP